MDETGRHRRILRRENDPEIEKQKVSRRAKAAAIRPPAFQSIVYSGMNFNSTSHHLSSQVCDNEVHHMRSHACALHRHIHIHIERGRGAHPPRHQKHASEPDKVQTLPQWVWVGEAALHALHGGNRWRGQPLAHNRASMPRMRCRHTSPCVQTSAACSSAAARRRGR